MFYTILCKNTCLNYCISFLDKFNKLTIIKSKLKKFTEISHIFIVEDYNILQVTYITGFMPSKIRPDVRIIQIEESAKAIEGGIFYFFVYKKKY